LIFDVSFSKMFSHSSILDIVKRQLMEPVKASLTSIWTAKQLIVWVLPSTFVLYLIGMFSYIRNKMYKKYDKLMLPILISLITLLELIPINTYGWNFPRYYIEFIPFMILSLTPIIGKIKMERKDVWKMLILLGIFIVYFLIIPDPYLPEVSEAFTQKNYLELGTKVLFNFDLIILPVILVYLFFRKNMDKDKFYKILIISSLLIFISVNIIQITKPYSTNNLYGDSIPDLKNTLNYLKENTNSSDRALLFDHVGYYFGNSDNSNWYNIVLCYSESCMSNVAADKDVKFIQLYPKDLERLDGKLKAVIEKDFSFDRRFGDYILYKRLVS
jgi:hypothetical protein